MRAVLTHWEQAWFDAQGLDAMPLAALAQVPCISGCGAWPCVSQ